MPNEIAPIDVAEAAFRLRQLANPAMHRIVRPVPQPISPGPDEFVASESEPTAFMYAYMALNTLYTYDWPADVRLWPTSGLAVGLDEARDGREYDKLKAFLDRALNSGDNRNGFLTRCQAIRDSAGNPPQQAFAELDDFRSKGLTKEEVQVSARRLHRGNDPTLVRDDAVIIFKGVYEVRCNIFHGRKSVTDLSSSDGQYRRIGIFRQYIVALLDTFLCELSRTNQMWTPYFDGRLQHEVCPSGVPRGTDAEHQTERL